MADRLGSSCASEQLNMLLIFFTCVNPEGDNGNMLEFYWRDLACSVGLSLVVRRSWWGEKSKLSLGWVFRAGSWEKKYFSCLCKFVTFDIKLLKDVKYGTSP